MAYKSYKKYFKHNIDKLNKMLENENPSEEIIENVKKEIKTIEENVSRSEIFISFENMKRQYNIDSLESDIMIFVAYKELELTLKKSFKYDKLSFAKLVEKLMKFHDSYKGLDLKAALKTVKKQLNKFFVNFEKLELKPVTFDVIFKNSVKSKCPGYMSIVHPKDPRYAKPLPIREKIAQRISNFIKNNNGPERDYLRIYGDFGCGKKSVICRAASILNLSTVIMDMQEIIEKEYNSWTEMYNELIFEYGNPNSLVCLDKFDYILDKYSGNDMEKIRYVLNFAENHFSQVVINLTELEKEKFPQKGFSWVDFKIKKLSREANLKLWSIYLQKIENIITPDLKPEVVADAFNFTPHQMHETIDFAKKMLKMYPEIKKIDKKNLFKAALQQSVGKLSEYAKMLTENYTWDDLILDEKTLNILKKKVFRIKYGNRILGYKENPGEKGHKLLFYGKPGTGKTATSICIARALNLEIFRVDSATVTSKWVGETKRNLSKLFHEAENSHVVLLIDECDGMFAKRTESGDSSNSVNDNVGYLLQLIENYNGIVILTTNLINNIDPAFTRRVYSVKFKKPEQTERIITWKVFLTKSGVLLDEDIDYEYLAKSFDEFTPAIINKIVITAAINAKMEKFYKKKTEGLIEEAKIKFLNVLEAIVEVTNCSMSCFQEYQCELNKPDIQSRNQILNNNKYDQYGDQKVFETFRLRKQNLTGQGRIESIESDYTFDIEDQPQSNFVEVREMTTIEKILNNPKIEMERRMAGINELQWKNILKVAQYSNSTTVTNQEFEQARRHVQITDRGWGMICMAVKTLNATEQIKTQVGNDKNIATSESINLNNSESEKTKQLEMQIGQLNKQLEMLSKQNQPQSQQNISSAPYSQSKIEELAPVYPSETSDTNDSNNMTSDDLFRNYKVPPPHKRGRGGPPPQRY